MVVYIVGAGPGDPKLLTIRAKELIETADVIIYDKLVNKEILNWAHPECQLLYVGKREKESGGSQEIQKRINELLEKYSGENTVVRLKGGDPFIFGRGGEEAQVCARLKIPFEIVPGISSAFAVPAYAGIPASHRDFNSCFAVLTGHEADKESSMIDWEHLPETLIILMGVSKIRDTAKKLIENGRNPKTPVAAIHRGTTSQQRTVVSDLDTISKEGVPLSPPVIFVVGPIAKLHSELSWFEEKLTRIKGKKVVLTGAKTHEPENRELVESYGMEVISMPLIEIVDMDFTIPSINDFDALVFTSQEGVKRVENEIDLSSFPGNTYAIGPKTHTMLKKQNLKPSMGERFNSSGLAEHILSKQKPQSRILGLRSRAATNLLKEKLGSTFEYTEIPIYDIKQNSADAELLKKGDVVFVMSASCAKSLAELPADLLSQMTIISIGPETSKHIPVEHVRARVHTIKGMIDSYLDHLWREQK